MKLATPVLPQAGEYPRRIRINENGAALVADPNQRDRLAMLRINCVIEQLSENPHVDLLYEWLRR
jgi:6-phosphogluconolactonase (cycloisomerase 2 family)